MASNTTNVEEVESFYPYSPSHVLPVVFAAIIGVSFVLHIYQTLLVISHFPKEDHLTDIFKIAAATDSGESHSSYPGGRLSS
jgi:hypothetical protein